MSWIGSEDFEFGLKRDREIRELCLKQGQGLNPWLHLPTQASVEYPPPPGALSLNMLYFETVCSFMHARHMYQFCAGLRISVTFSPVHPTLIREIRVVFRQREDM